MPSWLQMPYFVQLLLYFVTSKYVSFPGVVHAAALRWLFHALTSPIEEKEAQLYYPAAVVALRLRSCAFV